MENRFKELKSVLVSLNSVNLHKVLRNIAKIIRHSSFVLCGKGSGDRKFFIKELFWSLNSNNKLICQSLSHKGVIYSGIGARYVKTYFNSNEGKKLVPHSYWENIKTTQCKMKLEKLFNFALLEKKRNGGDEISDNYDILCIQD